MKIENNCIQFKSVPHMYEHEASGNKPNTIRLLTVYEYDQFIRTNIEHIHITNSETSDSFQKQLLSAIDVSEHFDIPSNRKMIVFSWR